MATKQGFKGFNLLMIGLIMVCCNLTAFANCEDCEVHEMDPTIIMTEELNKTIEQASLKDKKRFEKMIAIGNEFITGYYTGGLYEPVARWWNEYHDGRGKENSPWSWQGNNVTISGKKINDILDMQNFYNKVYYAGCPNIHLVSMRQENQKMILRYEFLIITLPLKGGKTFDDTHRGEVWAIEVSFNAKTQLDDMKFVKGFDNKAILAVYEKALFNTFDTSKLYRLDTKTSTLVMDGITEEQKAWHEMLKQKVLYARVTKIKEFRGKRKYG